MSDGLALEIRGASVGLGGHEGFTLRAPDITLTPGEAMSCVGPSGSGKTTLVRLAAGLLQPNEGIVRTLGVDLASRSTPDLLAWRVRNVGLVFQDFALLGHLTGLENILLPFVIGPGMRVGADERARATSLASSLEVTHTLKRRPDRMSHGERQRIAVCRALVTRPRLLLCDEPSASLDGARSRLVLDLIHAHRTAHECAVVVTTHDHTVASLVGPTLDLTPDEAVLS